MAEEPQYKRGPGGDPAAPPLEQGQATALNTEAAATPEATPPEPTAPEQAAPQAQPPDAFSVPTPPVPSPGASTDEERYLLGAPRPGEPSIQHAQPSIDHSGGLGLLDEAAQDPLAPPQVVLLRNLIAASLEQ